jgi:hypothetical protein
VSGSSRELAPIRQVRMDLIVSVNVTVKSSRARTRHTNTNSSEAIERKPA